tara:strand:- start:5558 stop:6808 length:1251 start_codon:yes stop_codon:yes gene_type:complete
MSVSDSFLAGEYQGQTFLFISNSQQGGRKSVSFEYTQSDNRTVQDLGKFLPVYDLTIWVTGDATDYRRKKESLLQALDRNPDEFLSENGRITNFTHPIDGKLAVKAGKYQVSEDSSSFGVCKISVKFTAVSDITYPVVGADDGSVNVKNALDNLIDEINKAFEESFNLVMDLQNLLKKILNYISELTSILANTLSIIDALKSTLSPFISELQSLKDNAAKLAQSPAELANSISSIYTAMTNLGKNNGDISIANQSIFGTNIGISQDITTESIQKSEQNRKVLNTHINSLSLVNELYNTVSSKYDSDDDIISQSDIITEQYNLIINNNFYVDENGKNINIFNQDLISNITYSYDNTIKYLEAQANNAKNIVIKEITNDSLLSLVYAYYGDVDSYNAISVLNKIGNPFKINGDLKLLV